MQTPAEAAAVREGAVEWLKEARLSAAVRTRALTMVLEENHVKFAEVICFLGAEDRTNLEGVVRLAVKSARHA